MNDNDIIKALEICLGSMDCPNCPYVDLIIDDLHCDDKLLKDVLDLINRQKAEIEELRKGFTADMDYFASEYDSKIKSEAIKEFAERLKEELKSCRAYDGGLKHMIDNLVNEMVGE